MTRDEFIEKAMGRYDQHAADAMRKVAIAMAVAGVDQGEIDNVIEVGAEMHFEDRERHSKAVAAEFDEVAAWLRQEPPVDGGTTLH